MSKETFLQVQKVSYAAGTPASTLYKELTLNSAYERCIGVCIYPILKGGIDVFRLGLADNNQDYINNIHYKALESVPEAGLEIGQRFHKVSFPAGGHRIKIRTEIPTQLATDLTYDFVFLLEREAKAS
ncbi:hypothetical protein [Algivirga pacifica]|uniref:Uncharacterized protein n=1 Tax=Algivirga pacifica TaxID=1162670 RepID=A0ABP9DJE5_9BACT